MNIIIPASAQNLLINQSISHLVKGLVCERNTMVESLYQRCTMYSQLELAFCDCVCYGLIGSSAGTPVYTFFNVFRVFCVFNETDKYLTNNVMVSTKIYCSTVDPLHKIADTDSILKISISKYAHPNVYSEVKLLINKQFC